MLGPMAYLVLVAIVSLSAGVYAAVRFHRGASVGLVMLQLALAALVCVFALGIPAGNFYSHGFDIPWWGFGAFGSMCMLVSAVLSLVVTRVSEAAKPRRVRSSKPLQATREDARA